MAIFGYLFKRYFLILEKLHVTILLKLRYVVLLTYTGLLQGFGKDGTRVRELVGTHAKFFASTVV